MARSASAASRADAYACEPGITELRARLDRYAPHSSQGSLPNKFVIDSLTTRSDNVASGLSAADTAVMKAVSSSMSAAKSAIVGFRILVQGSATSRGASGAVRERPLAPRPGSAASAISAHAPASGTPARRELLPRTSGQRRRDCRAPRRRGAQVAEVLEGGTARGHVVNPAACVREDVLECHAARGNFALERECRAAL
eukprot:scaffold62381_cov24-Tisochrysis_lutea.AAC.5